MTLSKQERLDMLSVLIQADMDLIDDDPDQLRAILKYGFEGYSNMSDEDLKREYDELTEDCDDE